jgi:hypothetical protein
VKDI